MSVAYLFTDLSDAFISMQRYLVIDRPLSDSDICHLFSKLNLPHDAFAQFSCLCSAPSALSQAGVDESIHRILRSYLRFSWFVVQGCGDVGGGGCSSNAWSLGLPRLGYCWF